MSVKRTVAAPDPDVVLLPGALRPDPAQERLDDVNDLIGVDEIRVIPSRQFHQPGSRHAVRDVPTVRDRDVVVRAMDEQSGSRDGAEHVPNVRLHVHPRERTDRPWARALPDVPLKPAAELLVPCDRRRDPGCAPLDVLSRPEVLLVRGSLLDLLLPKALWEVRCPDRNARLPCRRRRGRRCARDRSREENVIGPPSEAAEQGCPLRTGGVHDRPYVVHALLEGGQAIEWNAVGETGAAFVEKDEAARRREDGAGTGRRRVRSREYSR